MLIIDSRSHGFRLLFLYSQQIVALSMKKFLLVTFTLLYIGVSSGIALNLHYCMGKLANIKLGQTDTCASCGKQNQPSDCCSTETQLVKLFVDQNVHLISATDLTPVTIELLSGLFHEFSIQDTSVDATPLIPNESPHGWTTLPLFIHHCTFLI